MGADTAAVLLEEGFRLVADADALAGQPDAGPALLRLTLRLQDVVARAEVALKEADA